MFLIDLSKHGVLRLGDSLSTSAKLNEYFSRSKGESSFESIVVTYRCFRAVIMSQKSKDAASLSSRGYSVRSNHR